MNEVIIEKLTSEDYDNGIDTIITTTDGKGWYGSILVTDEGDLIILLPSCGLLNPMNFEGAKIALKG